MGTSEYLSAFQLLMTSFGNVLCHLAIFPRDFVFRWTVWYYEVWVRFNFHLSIFIRQRPISNYLSALSLLNSDGTITNMLTASNFKFYISLIFFWTFLFVVLKHVVLYHEIMTIFKTSTLLIKYWLILFLGCLHTYQCVEDCCWKYQSDLRNIFLELANKHGKRHRKETSCLETRKMIPTAFPRKVTFQKVWFGFGYKLYAWEGSDLPRHSGNNSLNFLAILGSAEDMVHLNQWVMCDSSKKSP